MIVLFFFKYAPIWIYSTVIMELTRSVITDKDPENVYYLFNAQCLIIILDNFTTW